MKNKHPKDRYQRRLVNKQNKRIKYGEASMDAKTGLPETRKLGVAISDANYVAQMEALLRTVGFVQDSEDVINLDVGPAKDGVRWVTFEIKKVGEEIIG